MNENPGPGAYSAELHGRLHRTGMDWRMNNFRSKAPRFAPNCPGANIYNYPSSYDNPGPGEYSEKDHEDKLNLSMENSKRVKLIQQKIHRARGGQRKSIPSIPSNEFLI